MGMGTDLHSTLRSLCFNTQWKYAVFWKLKHRARMVLTWEDGYYENCEEFSEIVGNLNGGGGCYSSDPVGLAVAKMSYHVYSLGEGIVGQVAVTGRHQWIFADKHITNSFSSFEVSDGWQSQFSAGIKTIVVVAVAPYGVVQLGSLNKVDEDMNLVTHIKDVFLTLQDSTGHGTTPLQCSMKNSLCLPGFPTRGLASEVIPDGISNLDKVANKGGPNDCFSSFPYLPRQCSSYVSCVSSTHQKTAVELTNKDEGVESSASMKEGSFKSLPSRPNISYLNHQNQLGMSLASNQKNLGGAPDLTATLHFNNCVKDNINLCVLQPSEKYGAGFASFPIDLYDSTVGDRKLDSMDIYLNGTLSISESSEAKLERDLEKKLDYQLESTSFDASNAFLNFSAGCELFEALGPAFFKRYTSFECDREKAEAGNIVQMPEGGISSGPIIYDSCSENLLEAVVGNACPSGSDVKSERTACKSVQSLLTTEKMPEVSSQNSHLVNSGGYSANQNSVFEEDTQNCSNSSGICGVMSSKGFSSTCPSTGSQHADKRSEPAKNKKRARPGENCRPRPRDRQLIQDRIKELRELVPSGSKCSIDSLLERTIKHMLFLESVTKHADKLNKCAESKMHKEGTDTSNFEQGSSWAVEVGGHLKVSSIIVENLNKNGQMLVEMLCEECSHFLEIAEAIRSLGLTILKGVTEVHGDKTWICFVVEGQNNRIMHRMDVLWSLVQILQPKTAN